MNDWVWVGLGAVVGVLAVVFAGRGLAKGSEKPAKPTMLGWAVLVFGLITLVLALLVTTVGSGGASWAWGGGIATVIAGVGAIVKRDRHWPTWVGLVLGVLSALFWALFAIGYLLNFGAQGVPTGEPDIRGVVISYEPGVSPTDLDAEPTAENYPSMLVVWTDDPSAGAKAEYDAAQVQTDGSTIFPTKIDGEYVLQGNRDVLRVGSVVEAWFTGAVRESYPVQATASFVVVVGSYDGELPTPAGLEP